MKRVVRLQTSVCFRITRLRNNQIKSRNRTTSQKEEKAKTRMLWLVWKMSHNWVVHHKIQMHWFLNVHKFRGNPTQKVSETNSKSTVHWVYATSSEYQRKGRTIVGKNKCQSSSSAKSLRCGIWGPVPWRDCQTTTMWPRSKIWNFAKNICKLKGKNKATFYFPAEILVLLAASTKELEEREFVVDPRARMPVVSQTDLDSAELETMRTSRILTTVRTANVEVQTREESMVHVKQLNFFVHSCHRIFFGGEVVLFRLFIWLFINLVMRKQTLVYSLTTHFHF